MNIISWLGYDHFEGKLTVLRESVKINHTLKERVFRVARNSEKAARREYEDDFELRVRGVKYSNGSDQISSNIVHRRNS